MRYLLSFLSFFLGSVFPYIIFSLILVLEDYFWYVGYVLPQLPSYILFLWFLSFYICEFIVFMKFEKFLKLWDIISSNLFFPLYVLLSFRDPIYTYIRAIEIVSQSLSLSLCRLFCLLFSHSLFFILLSLRVFFWIISLSGYSVQ